MRVSQFPVIVRRRFSERPQHQGSGCVFLTDRDKGSSAIEGAAPAERRPVSKWRWVVLVGERAGWRFRGAKRDNGQAARVRVVQGLCLFVLVLSAPRCEAQWYTGWYGGWSGEGSTPYSSAVKAHANLVAAEGQAAESYARAATAAEQARAQYLENQARYVEWRRQQLWITEERRAAKHAAMRAKAAQRPAPRAPTDLYPPLAPDQLDRLTGEIHWPPGLLDPEYATDRRIVEGALKTRAETGPDERTSSILHDAAWRMLSHSAPTMRQLDSQEHLACRRFLKSLMLEGEFSPGVLQ